MKTRKLSLGKALINAGLIVLSLVFLFPVFYTLMTSFRAPGYGLTSEIVPRTWYFGNYERLWQFGRFPRYIGNSIVYSLGGTIVTSVAAALAAYAFARLHFKGKALMQGMVFIIMTLPALTNMIPLFKIGSDLGMMRNYTRASIGMILIFGAYGVPLGIWIMKGF